MLGEDARATLPRYGGRKFDAACARDGKRGQAARLQILVNDADIGGADHVAGSGAPETRPPASRWRAPRAARGQKCRSGSGTRRRRRGVDLRELLAVPRAEKLRVRIFSRQRNARRPVADHQLAAGQIEVEKGLDILFDRDPADAEKDRLRQTEIAVARLEQCVSTPRDHSMTLRKPRARNSLPAPASPPSPPGRPVEARSTSRPRLRDRRARREIFGKAGVKAGGERQAALRQKRRTEIRSGLRSRYEWRRARAASIGLAICAGPGSASRISG